MNPLYYLRKLIRNGHYWQYTNVLNKSKKPKYFFLRLQWFFIVVSIATVMSFLNKGFNNEFVGYTNAVLAILTGLYLTVVISLFDKFNKDEFTKTGLTETQQNNLKIKKNFFIQFTSLTAYSIIISLFCLGLLSLSLLFESLDAQVTIKILIQNWQETKYLCFFALLGIALYRVVVLYFLINIIYLSSYILSSAYSYIVGEYDKTKIDNTKSS